MSGPKVDTVSIREQERQRLEAAREARKKLKYLKRCAD